jgi:hypothetical protein
MYRGQNRDFGKMLPSGLRQVSFRSEAIFRIYTQMLSDDLLESSNPLGPDGVASTFLMWTRAITQHYGPGSHFLDVTSSEEVALWFALHQFVLTRTHHLF